MSKTVADQRPMDAERCSIDEFGGFLAIEIVGRLRTGIVARIAFRLNDGPRELKAAQRLFRLTIERNEL